MVSQSAVFFLSAFFHEVRQSVYMPPSTYAEYHVAHTNTTAAQMWCTCSTIVMLLFPPSVLALVPGQCPSQDVQALGFHRHDGTGEKPDIVYNITVA